MTEYAEIHTDLSTPMPVRVASIENITEVPINDVTVQAFVFMNRKFREVAVWKIPNLAPHAEVTIPLQICNVTLADWDLGSFKSNIEIPRITLNSIA